MSMKYDKIKIISCLSIKRLDIIKVIRVGTGVEHSVLGVKGQGPGEVDGS